MNKKMLLLVAVFLFVGASVFSRSQFRLVGDVTADFVDIPFDTEIEYQLDYPGSFMSGFYWEVITNSKVGFGHHYLGRFSRISSASDYYDYNWWFDWNGDMFVSYHFLRAGRLFDPFLQVGYGCAGRLRMYSENENYWMEDDDGDWYYDSAYWGSSGGDDPALTNISLYPFIAAGLALDFKGFLISARVAYRPFLHPVPGTRFDNYPLKSIQVALSAGVAFGGHRK